MASLRSVLSFTTRMYLVYDDAIYGISFPSTADRLLIISTWLALMLAAVIRAEETTSLSSLGSSDHVESRTLKLQEHFYNVFKERYDSLAQSASSAASAVASAPAQLLKKPIQSVQALTGLSRFGWNFITDPLHAYPTAEDIKVHALFQRLTLFEINHADSIRRVLTAVKVLTIMKAISLALVLGVAVVGAVIAFVPFAAIFGRRSLSTSWHSLPSVNWDQLHFVASRVLTAIETAQTAYER
jgi:hypothetical protein